ncbi:MAG: hypothetical protein HYW89_04745 [Candidatus Sungiibacteriota bacterium]|uniref:Uncharacterized protein n=1 Tax=Candidatus Sungiibacteriota bacterium TaxID=2750080 RepID=A0A7T5UPV7_9BACT|nr:MAG: hypothetical protein HYW89_04745 [Candidatus Sungbacteria bacterium]
MEPTREEIVAGIAQGLVEFLNQAPRHSADRDNRIWFIETVEKAIEAGTREALSGLFSEAFSGRYWTVPFGSAVSFTIQRGLTEGLKTFLKEAVPDTPHHRRDSKVLEAISKGIAQGYKEFLQESGCRPSDK